MANLSDKISVAGAGGLSIVLVSDTDSPIIPANNKHYVADTTNGPIIFNVPVLSEGFQFAITDSEKTFATNNSTINPNGSETVDGSSVKVMNADKASFLFMADGTNLVTSENVIAGNGAISGPWTAFPSTLTSFGNGTAHLSYCQTSNESMKIKGALKVGSTPPSGLWTFSLPSGFNGDYSTLPIGVTGTDSYQRVGLATSYLNEYFTGHIVRSGTSTTDFFVHGNGTLYGSGLNWDDQVGSVTVSAGDIITIDMEVPIAEWQGSGTTNFNSDAIKRTKVVDLTLDSAPTGWSSTRVKGQAWADSDNNWVAWISVRGAISSATSGNFDFNGTSFELDSSLYGALAGGVRVEVDGADNSVVQWQAGSATPNVSFSGTILLTGEPTWAAANLEKNPAVGVEEATSEKEGVVGGSKGVAKLSGQIGEVINGTNTGATLTTQNVAYNVSVLTLDTGIYQVFGIAGCSPAGTTRSRYLSGISEVSGINPSGDYQNIANLAYENVNVIRSAIMPRIFNVTSSKTLYLVANCLFTGTAPQVLAGNTHFYAVRIG